MTGDAAIAENAYPVNAPGLTHSELFLIVIPLDFILILYTSIYTRQEHLLKNEN